MSAQFLGEGCANCCKGCARHIVGPLPAQAKLGTALVLSLCFACTSLGTLFSLSLSALCSGSFQSAPAPVILAGQTLGGEMAEAAMSTPVTSELSTREGVQLLERFDRIRYEDLSDEE